MNDDDVPMLMSDIELREASVDEVRLRSATSEGTFVEAAFEIMREVAKIVVVLASIKRRAPDARPRPLTRDEAVLGGLVVRLMKLLFGFLDGAAKSRGEIANYFTRGLFETATNILYLIKVDSLEAFDSFVAHSFRNDRRLLEVMVKKVAARGGLELPIERRMRESIERTLERSGLTWANVPTSKTDRWPGFEARLDTLQMKDAYAGAFGGPSSYVHGTWHELLFYNLTSVEPDGFELDTSWAAVRPQPLLAATFVIVMATTEYIEYLFAEYPETEILTSRLLAARDKAGLVDDLHEQFLNRPNASDA